MKDCLFSGLVGCGRFHQFGYRILATCFSPGEQTEVVCFWPRPGTAIPPSGAIASRPVLDVREGDSWCGNWCPLSRQAPPPEQCLHCVSTSACLAFLGSSRGVIFHSFFSQPSLHLISFAPPAVSLVRTPRHRPPWQAKSLLLGLLVSPSPLSVRLPSLTSSPYDLQPTYPSLHARSGFRP